MTTTADTSLTTAPAAFIAGMLHAAIRHDTRDALAGIRTVLRRFDHWHAGIAELAGVTLPQLDVLLAVDTATTPPSVGDIAAALGLRHHSTVELINRVEANGHLIRIRDHHDHRVVRLTLTAPGRRVLDRARAHPGLPVGDISTDPATFTVDTTPLFGGGTVTVIVTGQH